MALKEANETFTLFNHLENGKSTRRRIHKMEVQDRNGRLHTIIGDDLPEWVGLFSGQGMKGCHLAQILLSPNPAPAWTPDKANTLGLSHFVSFCIGFWLLVIVRFIYGLCIECF